MCISYVNADPKTTEMLYKNLKTMYVRLSKYLIVNIPAFIFLLTYPSKKLLLILVFVAAFFGGGGVGEAFYYFF